MYSQSKDLELAREELARLDEEWPEMPGPSFLHPLYITRRKRRLRKKIAKLEMLERQWKVKPPSCKGPSVFRILGTSLLSYWLVIIVAAMLFFFGLWYTGIFDVLQWLYEGFVFLFDLIVSTLRPFLFYNANF